MLNTPFSPWPDYSKEESDAISRVLLSNKVNYWTGTECRKFEKEFSEWADTKYAVALANGTLALDIALKALGIGQGDDVITTSRTFLATASSIVNSGARPIFADVDLNSQNIDADTISRVMTPNTKAIVVVHLGGMPAEMDDIMTLAEENGLFVIEDCAQAHGAKYKGRSVGSIGHIGAWSFCQDKIMTTGGEGGMVTTNDMLLWKRMWSYKDHGKDYDLVYNTEHSTGFRWLHNSFGTNWRMTEIQAVIGRIQLRRMNSWSERRASIANSLNDAVKGIKNVRLQKVPEYMSHAYYKHYMFVEPEHLKPNWTRDRIISEISKQGVPCYHGSCSEVYLEKSFDGTGFRPRKRLRNAKQLGEVSLMFLVHPTLRNEEVSRAMSVIRGVLTKSQL
ncbi:DegT/DnrJ/EryC1/StrS aminotransferase family protein [Ferrimonas sediminicola]|uniref:DegT/DnrJ/EryC1/StrS aminotransferase family protein n=1 Tax=Ferrimonas sediminicola TaxID=2569538 RepID=A0A4U1B7M0_9GAMM|nr:DegT/DnrJ/EryC1/StrS aminotransferase family protein [Ferrimonas sediminicola]TKB46462.1 DegT/DnrJ/EryC1/StrS aminotransferase family protein [Ferrimonas sediminicola]